MRESKQEAEHRRLESADGLAADVFVGCFLPALLQRSSSAVATHSENMNAKELASLGGSCSESITRADASVRGSRREGAGGQTDTDRRKWLGS
jgi:hypothetical protein